MANLKIRSDGIWVALLEKITYNINMLVIDQSLTDCRDYLTLNKVKRFPLILVVDHSFFSLTQVY